MNQLLAVRRARKGEGRGGEAAKEPEVRQGKSCDIQMYTSCRQSGGQGIGWDGRGVSLFLLALPP